jgi:hypothetical protein
MFLKLKNCFCSRAAVRFYAIASQGSNDRQFCSFKEYKIKMSEMFSDTLTFFKGAEKNYFVVGAAGGVVWPAPGFTGAVLVGNASVFPEVMSLVLDTFEFWFPSGDSLYADEKRLNAKRLIASTQVAFSRKSAVLRTPITWLDEENEEASPPPLEFCTRTTSIKRIQTMTINIEMIVPIVIYCFVD